MHAYQTFRFKLRNSALARLDFVVYMHSLSIPTLFDSHWTDTGCPERVRRVFLIITRGRSLMYNVPGPLHVLYPDGSFIPAPAHFFTRKKGDAPPPPLAHHPSHGDLRRRTQAFPYLYCGTYLLPNSRPTPTDRCPSPISNLPRSQGWETLSSSNLPAAKSPSADLSTLAPHTYSPYLLQGAGLESLFGIYPSIWVTN